MTSLICCYSCRIKKYLFLLFTEFVSNFKNRVAKRRDTLIIWCLISSTLECTYLYGNFRSWLITLDHCAVHIYFGKILKNILTIYLMPGRPLPFVVESFKCTALYKKTTAKSNTLQIIINNTTISLLMLEVFFSVVL